MKKKIIILNNSAIFGGPQKSIIQNINILKKDFEFIIITPKGSSLKNFLENNIKCIISPELPQFENTLFNYYFGLKWILLLREIIRFMNFFVFLILNKNLEELKNIDIVHGNEINLIPAIYLVKKIFKPKFSILHCRSLQNNTNTFVSKVLKSVYKKNVDLIISIDRIVANTLPQEIDIKIVYNSIYKVDISKQDRSSKKFIIGIAGNMSDVKGTNFIIETFQILKNQNHKNIFLYFLGDVPKNSFTAIIGNLIGVRKNYNNYLRNLNKLENIFFLGFRGKIDVFYKNIDLLCFPTEINAVGRTVIEAAQFKVPSLITVNSNVQDLDIANCHNSYFYNGRDKLVLAEKITEISKNKKELEDMGNKIFHHISKKCDANTNSEKLATIYKNF